MDGVERYGNGPPLKGGPFRPFRTHLNHAERQKKQRSGHKKNRNNLQFLTK